MHLQLMNSRGIALLSALLLTAYAAAGRTTMRTAAAKDRTFIESPTETHALERESAGTIYQWNLEDKEQPLLGLAQDHLNAGFDQSLSYATEQFDFLIFKALTFDDEQGKYLLPVTSKDKTHTFLEFAPGGEPNIYVSTGGAELLDKDSFKILKAADGDKY